MGLKLINLISSLTTLLIISMAFSSTRGILRSNNISPNDVYENQWALIIGINDYSDYDKLKYAVEDAKSIKTTLKTQSLQSMKTRKIFLIK
jgi:hypothetical protein